MRRESPPQGTPQASALQRPNLLEGENLPKLPAQQRSRARRDALLRTAVDLFARKGYDAASIGEIARRAGTSVGGFYQYFPSKRQLLLVLMNNLLENLEQIDMQPRGQGDLKSTIESVLRAGLATDLAYAGAYRAWREAMLSDPELAALDAQIRTWTTHRLSVVFDLLRRLPPGARSDFNVAVFAALMDRLFWDLLASPLRSDERLIPTLAQVIYHSLLVDSTASSS